MKPGKNVRSQARSASVFRRSSIGRIAFSSIRVWMSTASRIANCGGSPLLNAVSALVIES